MYIFPYRYKVKYCVMYKERKKTTAQSPRRNGYSPLRPTRLNSTHRSYQLSQRGTQLCGSAQTQIHSGLDRARARARESETKKMPQRQSRKWIFGFPGRCLYSYSCSCRRCRYLDLTMMEEVRVRLCLAGGSTEESLWLDGSQSVWHALLLLLLLLLFLLRG